MAFMILVIGIFAFMTGCNSTNCYTCSTVKKYGYTVYESDTVLQCGLTKSDVEIGRAHVWTPVT